jgi:hypothetical protein
MLYYVELLHHVCSNVLLKLQMTEDPSRASPVLENLTKVTIN